MKRVAMSFVSVSTSFILFLQQEAIWLLPERSLGRQWAPCSNHLSHWAKGPKQQAAGRQSYWLLRMESLTHLTIFRKPIPLLSHMSISVNGTPTTQFLRPPT